MIRKIIQIDESKCNGCGLCEKACHEEAIGIINGKAKLLRDDYCDGLGNCLPVCPTGAITFIEREALAYDEETVLANKEKKSCTKKEEQLSFGCAGSQSRQLYQSCDKKTDHFSDCISQLCQWPVQIKLAPVNAPYFKQAHLLIAADCTAYAYADFHKDYMKGKITLIGCPKLDVEDYSLKLTEILKNNDIKSLTIVRMEVPCCGGIEYAAATALKNSQKFIPWQVVTISIDGNVI